MAELPQEVSDAVAAFETNLNGIEAALAPFFADPELRNKLPPFESAKANLVMAYATNTLFYMYLKTQGIDPKDHPVKGELERIRTYIQKVRSLTDAEKERGNARSMVVDTAAAGRFVKAALGPQGSLGNKGTDIDADAMETDDIDAADTNSMEVDEDETPTPSKSSGASKRPNPASALPSQLSASKSSTAGKMPRRTEPGYGVSGNSPARKRPGK